MLSPRNKVSDFSILKAKKETKETVIIPLGLIQQDLEHKRSAAAFIQFSQKSSIPAEDKLTPAKIAALMPKILQADAKAKSCQLDSKEIRSPDKISADFRKEMRALLKLGDSMTDEQFDEAWNAMLGDLSKLTAKIQALKELNINIILITKSNPIQVEHMTGQQKASNPINLAGISLFVSYNCPQYQPTQEIELYKEVMKTENLDPIRTKIIVQSTSNSPFPAVKKQDEAIAQQIKEWAQSQRISVLDRNPSEDIMSVMTREKIVVDASEALSL